MPPGTQVLGRYNVLGKLTQGGMAEVYLANQRGPAGYSKLVVIKRVRPHLASDSDFVAMFVNEARLAALINHPNVVSIFDLGQDNDDWLLAMEFLDGRDMLQVGRACRQHNKAVPFDVTARIIADACAGLEHAHNLHGQDGEHLNLVHRDMSPENILITFEGSVKVVDFGIAKARDNALRTQAGQIKGKLGYVAPEAILGKALDARADIFAIGATLYLFLCGRPAFTGNNPMEIFEKSLQPPTAPREVNNRVPEALEAICLKCLAQDRNDRFASCGELRQALEHHLAASGRPLGAAQLAQFMKILFPAETDPVRQRINQLIAHGNAVAEGSATAQPSSTPVFFDDDKTTVAGQLPQTKQTSPPAPGLPADSQPLDHSIEDKTAIVTSLPEATSAPASVEFNIEEPKTDPRPTAVGFAHLRSVEIGADIDAERQALRQHLPEPTIDLDNSLDLDLEVDLAPEPGPDVEATMVNRELPQRRVPAEAPLADIPPPPVDDMAVITSESPPSDLSLRAATDEVPVFVPPAVPAHEPIEPLLPHEVAPPQDSVGSQPFSGQATTDFTPPSAPQPQNQQQALVEKVASAAPPPPADAPPAEVVYVPAPLAARLAMFLVGAVVGTALLAGGLLVIGDLEVVLAHAGVSL